MWILHLKHWQLFLIVYGIPIVGFFINFYIYLGDLIVNPDNETGQQSLRNYFLFTFLLSFLPLVITLLWYWQVGRLLYQKAPVKDGLSMVWFKTCLVAPLVWFAGYAVFIVSFFQNSELEKSYLIAFAIYAFLGLVMFAAFGYLFYFIGRSYKTALTGQKQELSGYIGEMILVWFLFIGIWIIQPEINKMAAGEETGLQGHVI